MGKKPQRHDWPEAKKLCRLNQDDIAMAKKLGFNPDSLIRARPDPKQKWKLPVKHWIRELHLKRFGSVLGEKPKAVAPPIQIEYDEEFVRRYGEELYMEEYWERNADPPKGKRRTFPTPGPHPAKTSLGDENMPPRIGDESFFVIHITDDDVPF